MVDRTPLTRHVRKKIHYIERAVQRYKRQPLDQEGLRGIHTDVVTDDINNYSMNDVHGVHFSPIEAEKISAARQTREVLDTN